jgi:hypothetical protein
MIFFTLFLMTIDPAPHIYNIQLPEIVIIIIIMLIHYHKGLRARGIDLPLGSWGLH